MYKRLFGTEQPDAAKKYSDEELIQLAVIKKKIGTKKVICNLTSIPTRFIHLQKIVDMLSVHLIFDKIVVHIPNSYKRFGPYEVPVLNGATVHVCANDYGPGTRIIEAEGDIVVYCDDDTEYHHMTSAHLVHELINTNTMCGTSGFNFKNYFLKDFAKKPKENVQVLEGYGMVACFKEWIDQVRDDFIKLEKFTYHDDMIFCNLLENIGVEKTCLLVEQVKQLQYGFGKDALHYNNGEGTHVDNNKKILKIFKDHGMMYHKPTVSYAITVCTEALELDNLLWALVESMIHCDEIVILVDSGKVTDDVRKVLDKYSNYVSIHEREFDGHFARHKNHLNSKCRGEYIMNIDADEIPSPDIVTNMYQLVKSDANLVYFPRVNLIPGATPEYLKSLNFNISTEGFINWPDMQGRLYKNGLQWEGDIHERIGARDKVIQVQPSPVLSIWHIKSIQKMSKQNEYYQKRVV
jgi:hypothetical protein